MLLKKSLEQKINTYIYSHVYSTVCLAAALHI